MPAILPILEGIGTAVGALEAGKTIFDWLRPKPKNPSILDYIMMYAPQVINLIVLVCLILMYISLVKKYKLKKVFLFYTALITLTFYIFIFLSDLI
ncbi:MAG: hypothetical protein Q4P14_06350 [Methanobacteriaceae archaeon]|nr:hypothetical protein [Methanobacteriaceae archaeon]